MNYLAIDTASKYIKVLVNYNGISGYFQSAEFKSASDKLMPEVDRLMSECGAKLSDMDFFACVTGPGSFTGIRIGMATIKAFAYACKKPVVAVNSLEVLAYNSKGEETVTAVCDASNGMRYVAVYDERLHEVMPPRCLEESELAEFVSMIDEPNAIYGDDVCQACIKDVIVPDDFRIAFTKVIEAKSDFKVEGNLLEPLYIRKPQAEADLEKKNA